MSPEDALRGFLETLGVAPQRIPGDFGAQASLYRSMLNGRRILVLLDNVRDIEQVRPLLPGSPGCLVLITSRNRLPGLIAAHGAHAVSLDTLPADEARQAMALRLGSARLAAEPDALDEIIDRCGGLPLAMAVVAARATVYQDLPLAEIASELRDARTRLDALSADGAAADVRAVFSWSYRLLSVPARRLFRLLSVHGGPELSSNAAASLAGLPRAEIQPLLAELTGARLLTEHRPGRFTSHDLTRVYAAELSATEDAEDDRRDALGLLLGYYLHTACRAHLLLQPNFAAPDPGAAQLGVTSDELSGYQQAMGWFAAEREALQAAVRDAGQSKFYAQAWLLALTIQHAMTIYRELGDLNGESDCWVRLGEFHHLLGEHEQALSCHRRAVALWRGLGNRADEAVTLVSLGDSALAAGKPAQAREAWESAVTVLTELGLPAASSVCRKLASLAERWDRRAPVLAGTVAC